MKFTAVKGMHDLMPPDSASWAQVERIARELFASYGFVEIRTPIVEKTPLFVRSVGETNTMVEKEMYSFIDQGNEPLTLRPEGTAPVIRAYVEHGAYQDDPVARYFYLGPYFRRERPQKGRYRQFHQIGVELIGTASPEADGEVMTMLMRLLAAVGLPELRLEINSLGCHECRPRYYDTLREYLEGVAERLCADCQRRLKNNPMRLFDCKQAACQLALQEAPTVQDFWCGPCGEHFHAVGEYLQCVGITYWVNHRIVRGLDYYVRTAFEVVTPVLGAQSAIAGGGRYDGLVKTLGGPDSPGIGFALGLERLLMLLAQQAERPTPAAPSRIFFAALGAVARAAILPLMEQLRQAKCIVEWDYDDHSLKAQMRRADRSGADYVVIVGEDEIQQDLVVVRNMVTKAQETVAVAQLVAFCTTVRAPLAESA